MDGIIFYGWKNLSCFRYFLPRIGVVDVKLVVGEEENPNRIKLPIGTEIGNVRFDGVYKKLTTFSSMERPFGSAREILKGGYFTVTIPQL